jgi:uncharacterized membrane protein YecN with MAPEG domain
VLHALGLTRSAGASKARQIGTILNWIVLLIGGGAALVGGLFALAG